MIFDEVHSFYARSDSVNRKNRREIDLTSIAAALDYAHGEGVIHRDVKPGNVMIAKDGTSYIIDFSIAREIQETMTRETGKMPSGILWRNGSCTGWRRRKRT